MQRVKGIASRRLPKDYGSLVRMFPPQAIADEVAYDNMQEIIDELTCIPERTEDQASFLQTLTILFEDYEKSHHAIDLTNVKPLDVLKSLVEEHGMSASTLGELLGDRALGSRILRGERELSKAHIRALAKHFSVSVELLL